MFNQYSCTCGAKFRTAIDEAKHRHNFPLLCKTPKKPRDGGTYIGKDHGEEYYAWLRTLKVGDAITAMRKERVFAGKIYKITPKRITIFSSEYGGVWSIGLSFSPKRRELTKLLMPGELEHDT